MLEGVSVWVSEVRLDLDVTELHSLISWLADRQIDRFINGQHLTFQKGSYMLPATGVHDGSQGPMILP